MEDLPTLTPRRPPTAPKKLKRKAAKVRKERDFNLSTAQAKIPEYNALQDEHLGSFFRSRIVQRTLLQAGLIDRHGRIIDVERNKGKLNIIEQEFRSAERAEEQRLREEEEARKARQIELQRRREELAKWRKIEAIKEAERRRHEQFLSSQVHLTTLPLPPPPRPRSSVASTPRPTSRFSYTARSAPSGSDLRLDMAAPADLPPSLPTIPAPPPPPLTPSAAVPAALSARPPRAGPARTVSPYTLPLTARLVPGAAARAPFAGREQQA